MSKDSIVMYLILIAVLILGATGLYRVASASLNKSLEATKIGQLR